MQSTSINKTYKTPSDLAYEKKLREYYLKAFLSEFSKILIFFLAALYLHIVKEYFAALFYLMILRNNGGGLHFKHYARCLIVSFGFLFASIGLAFHFKPHRCVMIVALLLCTILGQKLVPVTSTNRPAPTEEQIRNSKRSTVLIILSITLIICTCPLNLYVYIGFWTTVLHIIQLFIAHMKGGNAHA